MLESLLKDRIQVRRDTIVQRLEPDNLSEKHIEKAFTVFDEERPAAGQLQIIQGAVGAGKSLFIRRYKEVLQPPALMARCRWAWVDFGSGSFDLSNAQVWLARAFNEVSRPRIPKLTSASEKFFGVSLQDKFNAENRFMMTWRHGMRLRPLSSQRGSAKVAGMIRRIRYWACKLHPRPAARASACRHG